MSSSPFNTPDFDALLKIQFEVPSEKRKPEYGLKLSEQMWTFVSFGNNGYYQNRYEQWNKNEEYAKGTTDNREFLQLMGIQGNESLINIDRGIVKLIPRYLANILGGFMNRDEKPSVKATDALAEQTKKKEKQVSKMYMEEQEKIKNMEKISGLKLQKGYVPEDDDELDLYYKIEYRLPEEAFFQKTIDQIIENSGKDYLKRKLLRDGCVTNLMATKLEKMPKTSGKTLANRLFIRRCKPKNCVYNIFENDNGSDVSIFGEAYPIKISEARRKYPKVTEKEWFDLAQNAQTGLNQTDNLTWYESYISSFNRPYDDYSILVYDYEVKVYDKEYHVSFKREDGTTGVHQKKGRPGPSNSTTPIETERFNVYCGVWAVNTKIMLHWDVSPYIIRPYQNGVDCFLNYSVVYPNADGYYVPSLLERGIPAVRAMIMTVLNIAKMVSQMKSDGLEVDIANLHSLDLGQGPQEPLELMKIYDATGRAYYDSTDQSGTGFGEPGKSPFREIKTGGNVAQITMLIQLYNFWLQRLNDEWGVNQDSLGGAVPAKRGKAVSDNQVQAANNNTEYVYDAYIEIMEQNATKIAYALWDMIVLEGEEYKQMAGINRDMMDATFDVNINMVSKSADAQYLEMMVEASLQRGTLTPSQALKIQKMSHENATMYLDQMEKRAKKQARAQAQMQMEMNQKVQQMSTETKTQGKIKELEAQAQAKILIEKAHGDNEAYKEVVKLVAKVYEESIASGDKDGLAKMMPLMDYIISNTVAQNDQAHQPPQQQGQGQPQGQPQPQQQAA